MTIFAPADIIAQILKDKNFK